MQIQGRFPFPCLVLILEIPVQVLRDLTVTVNREEWGGMSAGEQGLSATCPDEEDAVGFLVEGDDAVHRQAGEVHALGQQ